MRFSHGPFPPLLAPIPRRPSRMRTGTRGLDLHRSAIRGSAEGRRLQQQGFLLR